MNIKSSRLSSHGRFSLCKIPSPKGGRVEYYDDFYTPEPVSPVHRTWALMRSMAIMGGGVAAGVALGNYAGGNTGLLPAALGGALGAVNGLVLGGAAAETSKNFLSDRRQVQLVVGTSILGAATGLVAGGLSSSGLSTTYLGLGGLTAGAMVGAVGGTLDSLFSGLEGTVTDSDGSALLTGLAGTVGGLSGMKLAEVVGTSTGLLPGLGGAVLGAPLGTVAAMAALDFSGAMHTLDMDKQTNILGCAAIGGAVLGAAVGAFVSVPSVGDVVKVGLGIAGAAGAGIAMEALMDRL